jgi:holliday junction DNA helicase RuvA
MIGYLEGTILTTTNTGIILLVGPIGYDIASLRLSGKSEGETLALYIHLAIDGNNQQTLIGFETLEGRTIFRQLLKVPGVGPKTALSVIESSPLDSVKNAIITSDLSFFTSVKGVGKKAAQKIILELKNELIDDPVSARTHAHIYDALTSLRFSNSEISRAIQSHDLAGLSESESIKIILQSLGR